MEESSYSDELAAISKAAEEGDNEAGEKLLRVFAGLAREPDENCSDYAENAHPELVRHIARCLARILDEGMDPREALCIKRPKHRPLDKGKIATRHDAALHAYCHARAQGQTHVEASNTSVGEVAGLTESVMKSVYEDAGKFKRDILIALYTHEVGT